MNIKQIESFFSYLAYFIVAVVLSYAMQWVTMLFIGSVRFTAADSYPGDLSSTALIIMSVVFPMIHFGVLSMYLGIQSLFVSLLKVKFQMRIPFVLNIFITLCLIGYFLYVFLFFDKSLLS